MTTVATNWYRMGGSCFIAGVEVPRSVYDAVEAALKEKHAAAEQRVAQLEALREQQEAAWDLAQRMQAQREASRDGRWGYELRWAHESELGGVQAVERFIEATLEKEPTK